MLARWSKLSFFFNKSRHLLGIEFSIFISLIIEKADDWKYLIDMWDTKSR